MQCIADTADHYRYIGKVLWLVSQGSRTRSHRPLRKESANNAHWRWLPTCEKAEADILLFPCLAAWLGLAWGCAVSQRQAHVFSLRPRAKYNQKCEAGDKLRPVWAVSSIEAWGIVGPG